MLETSVGIPVNSRMVHGYFKRLVNNLFKILPMRENNEESLATYIYSLQSELLGCKNLIVALSDDPNYLTILSILQFLIDNPECSISQVKREVFRAISVCNKMRASFLSQEV